jgi:hypothetical protein
LEKTNASLTPASSENRYIASQFEAIASQFVAIASQFEKSEVEVGYGAAGVQRSKAEEQVRTLLGDDVEMGVIMEEMYTSMIIRKHELTEDQRVIPANFNKHSLEFSTQQIECLKLYNTFRATWMQREVQLEDEKAVLEKVTAAQAEAEAARTEAEAAWAKEEEERNARKVDAPYMKELRDVWRNTSQSGADSSKGGYLRVEFSDDEKEDLRRRRVELSQASDPEDVYMRHGMDVVSDGGFSAGSIQITEQCALSLCDETLVAQFVNHGAGTGAHKQYDSSTISEFIEVWCSIRRYLELSEQDITDLDAQGRLVSLQLMHKDNGDARARLVARLLARSGFEYVAQNKVGTTFSPVLHEFAARTPPRLAGLGGRSNGNIEWKYPCNECVRALVQKLAAFSTRHSVSATLEEHIRQGPHKTYNFKHMGAEPSIWQEPFGYFFSKDDGESAKHLQNSKYVMVMVERMRTLLRDLHCAYELHLFKNAQHHVMHQREVIDQQLGQVDLNEVTLYADLANFVYRTTEAEVDDLAEEQETQGPPRSDQNPVWDALVNPDTKSDDRLQWFTDLALQIDNVQKLKEAGVLATSTLTRQYAAKAGSSRPNEQRPKTKSFKLEATKRYAKRKNLRNMIFRNFGPMQMNWFNKPGVMVKADVKVENVQEDDGAGPSLPYDSRYEKYFKMLKMGIPKPAVMHQMTADGLDPTVLD